MCIVTREVIEQKMGGGGECPDLADAEFTEIMERQVWPIALENCRIRGGNSCTVMNILLGSRMFILGAVDWTGVGRTTDVHRLYPDV